MQDGVFSLGVQSGIEKSAEMTSRERAEQHHRRMKHIAGAGAGLGLGVAGERALSKTIGDLAYSSVKPHGRSVTTEDIKGIKSKLGVNPHFQIHPENTSGIHISPTRIHNQKNLAEYYKQIGMTPSQASHAMEHGFVAASRAHPEILAHEMGHAALRKNTAVGKGLTYGRMHGIVPMIGTGLGGAMALSGDAKENKNRIKYAPLAALAGHAPQLIDEAGASIKGYNAIKSLGRHSPEILKIMRRNLMKLFGTYGAAAAGATLPILGISQYRLHRQRQKEKRDQLQRQ